MNLVFLMSVETSRNKDKIWLELNQTWEYFLCKLTSPVFSRGMPRSKWHIQNTTWVYWSFFNSGIFFERACTGVEYSTLLLFVIIVQVYGSKQDILSVVKIKPWFIKWGGDLGSSEWRTVFLDCERFGSHHCFHDFLSSISMVHIKIYNCNFLDLGSIMCLKIRCSYCDVINVAEPIGTCF